MKRDSVETMRCLFFRVNRRLRFFIPFRIHRISGESQIPKRINLSVRARACAISLLLPWPNMKSTSWDRKRGEKGKHESIHTKERKKKKKWAAAANHEERTLMQDRVGERSRLAHVQTKKKFERNRIKDLFLNALRRPTMNQGIKGGKKKLMEGKARECKKSTFAFLLCTRERSKKIQLPTRSFSFF